MKTIFLCAFATSLLAAPTLASTPVLGDDVNVHVQLLPNETDVKKEAVSVVCTVDENALMKDCRVADASQVSAGAAAQAVATVDHKSHAVGHYHAGDTVTLHVTLRDAPETPFLLVR